MNLVPDSILETIKYGKSDKEEIIYNDECFIVLKDPKFNSESYYYTAWIKLDIRNIMEINEKIINQIFKVKEYLLEKNIIKENDYIFIHFPPRYWRLHVHFAQNNYILKAPPHEIFYLNDIKKFYQSNPKFFKTNVVIKNRCSL